MSTLLPQTHLYLQRLEVIRDIGFDLPTHSLPRPLLETTELFVDIHVGVAIYYGLYSGTVKVFGLSGM